MQKINKQTDVNLSIRVADAVAQEIPGLSIAWNLGKALFGNAIELRQQRAIDFIEAIRDDPSIYTQQILKTQAFQDGFVYALECHIRMREKNKRLISKKIFHDFASTNINEQFELERAYATLSTISDNAIKFMGFIESELLPKQIAAIHEDIQGIDLSKTNQNEAMMYELVAGLHPISQTYALWKQSNSTDTQITVPTKPNPATPHISGSISYTVMSAMVKLHEEAINELTALGIIKRDRYSVTDPGWNASKTFVDYWRYTEYGKDFARFLKSV